MRIMSSKLFLVVTVLTIGILTPSFLRAQDAATTYKTKCASHHGPDGKGNTAVAKALAVRDFSSPEVQKETDAELIAITQNGRNKMPGYAKSLKPDQIKDLVAYIRDLAKR
jgi:cytochrome c6